MFSKAISTFVATAAIGFALLAGGCAAQEQPKPAAAMTPEDQAKMMEAYMKAAQPGPEHVKLKEYAGEWDATIKSWNPDGSACGGGTGTMSSKMALGDRYLVMNFSGEMTSPMGQQKYHGMGTCGYDNGAKKYFNTWIDDMGTGMMSSKGTMSGNTLTSQGSFVDPLTGQETKTKEVLTLVDKDHQTFALYMQSPDGSMYKCMEISYTRK